MVYKMLQYFMLPPADLLWASLNWMVQTLLVPCCWSAVCVEVKNWTWIPELELCLYILKWHAIDEII